MIKLKIEYVFLSILIVFSTSFCFAQEGIDLDSMVLAKSKKYINSDISAKGKINLSSEYNYAPLAQNSFFNYNIRANLIANIYGCSIPLNFSFSNAKTVYGYDLNPIKLPSFNRIGFSPAYKKWKLHVGYRQLNYTKYTLNGLMFKGLAAEYESDDYYFSLMKGQLKPAVIEDLSDITLQLPSFRRDILGLKTGINKEKFKLGLAFQKTIDDPLSILEYENYNKKILPQENAVVGLYGLIPLFKDFSLDFDYAFSGFSKDIVNDPFLDITTNYTAYNYFGLFTTRHKSIYDKAFRSSLKYSFREIDLSYNFELVDPDFRTLGAYFFNNNFVTQTIQVATEVVKNKLSVNFELGSEKIAELKQNQEQAGRLIAAINTKYKINDAISFSGKYSNLNNSNLIRTPSIQVSNLDSIIQTQTKEKFNLNSNIKLNKVYMLNIYGGYQKGIVVENNLFLTQRINRIKNFGTSLSINGKSNSQSINYSFTSIDNSLGRILTHNISHTINATLFTEKDININTSLSIMKSNLIQNITLQNQISYDVNLSKANKIRTSIVTQYGRSMVDEGRKSIFSILLKAEYDLGFQYKL